MTMVHNASLQSEARFGARMTAELLAVPVVFTLHSTVTFLALLHVRNEILHEFRGTSHLHLAWPVFLAVSIVSLVVLPCAISLAARHFFKSKRYFFSWLLISNVAWFFFLGNEFYITWIRPHC